MNEFYQKLLLARKLTRELLSDDQLEAFLSVQSGRSPFHFATGIEHFDTFSEQAKRARNLAIGMVGLLNLRPTGYRDEYNGRLVHDIMPKPGKDNEASSSGRAALPMHSDMAFLRFSGEVSHTMLAAAPDFLVLVGVANVDQLPTRIITLEEILENLDKKSVEDLHKEDFCFHPPESVRAGAYAENSAVLRMHSSRGLQIRYNGAKNKNGTNKVQAQSKDAEEALAKLDAVLTNESIGKSFTIMPGSILVFNNRKVLHGRNAIAPSDMAENEDKGTNDEETKRAFRRAYAHFIDTDSNSISDRKPFVHAFGG